MDDLKAGLQTECKILIRRLSYLEKRANNTVPKGFGYSSEEEKIAVIKRLSKYANDNMRRNISIKAYFTRLIFTLIHLFKIDGAVKKKVQEIKIKPQKRFKRKAQVDVTNFEELILFFGDAIRHPEEEGEQRSPRRSVKYNLLDENMFMWSFYDENTRDVFFRMGDCEVRLSEIKSFLKQI